MNKLKLLLSLAITLCTAFGVIAQDTAKKKTESEILTAIETEPRFQGSFGAFLGNNIKYPEIDWIAGITGKVYLQFVVEKDGTLNDIRVLKAPDSTLAAEAVRIVSMSPPWTPGVQNGKPVRVMYTVPINFTLDGVPAKIPMDRLRKSNYGFVFSFDGQVYSLDEAKKKLGKSFDHTQVESIKKYDDPKYAMPDKKAVYMITMKKDA